MMSDRENLSFEKHSLNATDLDGEIEEPAEADSALNPTNLQTNRNLINTEHESDQATIPESWTSLRKKNTVYRFTDDDIVVLNKIVGISLIIIFICLVLLIIGVLMKTTSVLENPRGTISLLVISFFLEIVSFYFIFKLFISEIKSSEYENLKIIGDIENYLKHNKNNQKVLKFQDIHTTAIYKRIAGFMKIQPQEIQN